MADSIRLSVSGMMCAGCVASVEKAIAETQGVEKVSVNLGERTAILTGTPDIQQVIQAIRKAGFDAAQLVSKADELKKQQQEQKQYHTLWWRAVIAGGVGFLLMFLSMGGFLPGIEDSQLIWLGISLICLLILIFVGGHFFTGAWTALKNKRGNMDTLVALGTGTAWLYSTAIVLFPDLFPTLARHAYFEAAVIIVSLVSLGSALEMRARSHTSDAIKNLIGLQPDTASVIREGKEIQLPLEDIGLDESIRIRPGDRIPVDGVLLEGQSHVDESMLTGEPVAVKKQPGEQVYAGTINSSGSFLMQSNHIGRDTALAHIIEQVRQAQSSKPPIARLVDQVAAVFVPVVVVIAFISFLVWFNWGPEPALSYAMVSAMTVLVIACPCALGLATPISIMVSVGRAASLGMLIRNGDALQQSSRLTTVLLDKTGTVTEGKPSVTNIKRHADISETEILWLAASVETASSHPLAHAINEKAKAFSMELLEVENFLNIEGQGVQASLSGNSLLVGNKSLMESNGVTLGDMTTTENNSLDTIVYVARNEQLVGRIFISDPLREDSGQAIERLHNLGLKVMLLTGDNQQVATHVAGLVNIDEVHSQLLPGDKLDIIRQLQKQGEVVAMVGDGINDAPALAQADVGIAIGTGADVAIESADITLMQASLHKVADVIALSKSTVKNIRQNLLGAFFYNSLGIPVAAGVLFPFSGILLSPVFAAAAMSLSSVTVVSNALRLRNADLHS